MNPFKYEAYRGNHNNDTTSQYEADPSSQCYATTGTGCITEGSKQTCYDLSDLSARRRFKVTCLAASTQVSNGAPPEYSQAGSATQAQPLAPAGDFTDKLSALAGRRNYGGIMPTLTPDIVFENDGSPPKPAANQLTPPSGLKPILAFLARLLTASTPQATAAALGAMGISALAQQAQLALDGVSDDVLEQLLTGVIASTEAAYLASVLYPLQRGISLGVAMAAVVGGGLNNKEFILSDGRRISWSMCPEMNAKVLSQVGLFLMVADVPSAIALIATTVAEKYGVLCVQLISKDFTAALSAAVVRRGAP